MTAARATVRDALVILLAVAALAWLSALTDTEPGLPALPDHDHERDEVRAMIRNGPPDDPPMRAQVRLVLAIAAVLLVGAALPLPACLTLWAAALYYGCTH